MRLRRGRRPPRWLRRALGLVALAAVVFAGYVAWAVWSWITVRVDTRGEVSFTRPLVIPELAPSELVGGERVFDLRLQEGTSDFGQGGTPTWGVNGSYLGPTLRAQRGEAVRMRVSNGLPERTSLHWHGMHLPAEMDGGPHQPIDAGGRWEPHWRIDQAAATLWYHPHLHGDTARHVYRGLAGMFVLDDAEEQRLDLPRTYGLDDIPVILQDKELHADGTLDEDPGIFQSAGLSGDTVVVNGTVGPYLDVTTDLVRLRLVNASNTRPYTIGFDDGRSFAMIAGDGGLLTAPATLSSLQLSVGERAEIVVAMEPGERVVMRSGPSDSGDRLAGGADHLDLLELRTGDSLQDLPPLPATLVDQPVLDPHDATTTRTFDLSGLSINGRAMDSGRIDHTVTVGDTEIWEVTNVDGGSHNFHVHDVQFQVLDIDGADPPPPLRGQKDTIWIRPGETVRLIMRFTDYASTRWPYMFHCHTLRHEDFGMMGQFVVVPSDQHAGALGGDHDSHD